MRLADKDGLRTAGDWLILGSRPMANETISHPEFDLMCSHLFTFLVWQQLEHLVLSGRRKLFLTDLFAVASQCVLLCRLKIAADTLIAQVRNLDLVIRTIRLGLSHWVLMSATVIWRAYCPVGLTTTKKLP